MWTNHAEMRNTEDAQSASRPLEFPTPKVHKALCVSLTALDHRSGRVYKLKNVLLRSPENSHNPLPDRAYLVKKKAAKSAFGSVRQCIVLRRHQPAKSRDCNAVEWESTDEIVALKASSWDLIDQRRGKHMEDPIKEVAALQHVGSYHPNVLGCIEVLQDDDFLYCIMPYYAGGDLYGAVMKNCESELSLKSSQSPVRPNEKQARTRFRELLAGLSHLQNKGVCHRDLSLENLLLDETDQVVIGDLGLALRVPYTDSSTFYGAVCDVSEGSQRRLITAQGICGNLTYIAPEIIAGEDFDGYAVDLWSAGVILFIMLVGRAPFQWAHNSDQRFAQISSNRLREMIKHIGIPLSNTVIDLLQNMLCREPKKRLLLREILSHPWMQVDAPFLARPIFLPDLPTVKGSKKFLTYPPPAVQGNPRTLCFQEKQFATTLERPASCKRVKSF
jgi:serine/threonine protein kinase